MTRWEFLEDNYLIEMEALGVDFNSQALARDLGIGRQEASGLIAAYVAAQTRVRSQTRFVLTRRGRTYSTVWHVGARAADVRTLGSQTAEDLQTRVEGFVLPTLRRIQVLNPRALPAANAVAKAIEASVELLAAMLIGDE